MPSYVCRHPTCDQYLAAPGFCASHADQAQDQKAARHRHYDQHHRDREAKQFYNSSAWQHARMVKLTAQPVCERCRESFAQHVHHVEPLRKAWALRLVQSNLMALCPPCHNAIEAEAARNAA